MPTLLMDDASIMMYARNLACSLNVRAMVHPKIIIIYFNLYETCNKKGDSKSRLSLPTTPNMRSIRYLDMWPLIKEKK